MEFEGTVYKIMPVTKGTSARGEWQRQDVVCGPGIGSAHFEIALHAHFRKQRAQVIVPVADGWFDAGQPIAEGAGHELPEGNVGRPVVGVAALDENRDH